LCLWAIMIRFLFFKSSSWVCRSVFILPNTGQGMGAWGGAAVLVGRSRDRFPVVSLDFQWHISFRPHHGPGVDSAPSENEYQEHSWGWRRPVRQGDDLTNFKRRMSWKSGSLNFLEPSGPHRAFYGTPSPFFFFFLLDEVCHVLWFSMHFKIAGGIFPFNSFRWQTIL
jgi:hypothetical protein